MDFVTGLYMRFSIVKSFFRFKDFCPPILFQYHLKRTCLNSKNNLFLKGIIKNHINILHTSILKIFCISLSQLLRYIRILKTFLYISHVFFYFFNKLSILFRYTIRYYFKFVRIEKCLCRIHMNIKKSRIKIFIQPEKIIFPAIFV